MSLSQFVNTNEQANPGSEPLINPDSKKQIPVLCADDGSSFRRNHMLYIECKNLEDSSICIMGIAEYFLMAGRLSQEG